MLCRVLFADVAQDFVVVGVAAPQRSGADVEQHHRRADSVVGFAQVIPELPPLVQWPQMVVHEEETEHRTVDIVKATVVVQTKILRASLPGKNAL